MSNTSKITHFLAVFEKLDDQFYQIFPVDKIDQISVSWTLGSSREDAEIQYTYIKAFKIVFFTGNRYTLVELSAVNAALLGVHEDGSESFFNFGDFANKSKAFETPSWLAMNLAKALIAACQKPITVTSKPDYGLRGDR